MRPRVLLAGHLDTVPAQDNLPGRRGFEPRPRARRVRHEGRVRGDARAGARAARRTPRCSSPARSCPSAESALTPLLERVALDYEFVVVMEPTDNELHAGCVGNINASWAFRGRSGHSARPWQAENAITAPRSGIAALASAPILPVTFEGLTFYEVASVTKVAGGIAMNVIPETCTAHVNFRYAPGRTPAEAEARLHELTGGLGELTITGNSGSGAVAVDHPLARKLIEAGTLARRAQAGVDAGRRVRRGGLPGGQLRPGRARAGAPARRVDRDRRAAAVASRCWRPSARERAALPRAGRARHVPVRAPRAGRARGCAPPASRSSTSAWASRARRRRRSSARRWRARSRRWRRTRARSACPELRARDRRLGSAPLRRDARPGHRGHPDARLQGGGVRARERLRRRRRGRADARRTRSTTAARCSPASGCSSCR